MPSYTERFSEAWELIDVVYGVAVAGNTETNSGWNDVGNYHRLAIVIDPVSLNDALDVDIEQATSSAGAGIKTVDSNSKDITVATTDTAPSCIEIQEEEMDVTGKFNHIQIEITTANTQGDSNYFVAKLYGLPRFQPAATTNWDSITD